MALLQTNFVKRFFDILTEKDPSTLCFSLFLPDLLKISQTLWPDSDPRQPQIHPRTTLTHPLTQPQKLWPNCKSLWQYMFCVVPQLFTSTTSFSLELEIKEGAQSDKLPKQDWLDSNTTPFSFSTHLAQNPILSPNNKIQKWTFMNESKQTTSTGICRPDSLDQFSGESQTGDGQRHLWETGSLEISIKPFCRILQMSPIPWSLLKSCKKLQFFCALLVCRIFRLLLLGKS